MAAFTPHQLYREQLRVLANPRLLRPLIASLTSETHTDAEAHKVVWSQFAPGSRPYAKVYLNQAEAPLRLWVLECFAAEPPSTTRDNGMPGGDAQHHACLGWIRLSPWRRDARLPGLRAARHIGRSVSRVRYHPGLQLRAEITTTETSIDLAFLRPRAAARLFHDSCHLRTVLGPHAGCIPQAPQLRPRSALLLYERPPAMHLAPLLSSDLAEQHLDRWLETLLAIAHAPSTAPASTRPDAQQQRYWRAVAELQSLAQGYPGLSDLAAELIASLTSAHARSSVGKPIGYANAQLHAWGMSHNAPVLLQAVRQQLEEAELLAAEVCVQIANRNYAHGTELEHQVLNRLRSEFATLSQRKIRLYRAHFEIRSATAVTQRIAPSGDEVARAHLLKAQTWLR